eukprot:CAMPEP_0178426162 /NCGR_PEP_ID=MMETSP0689_2-20121128/29096_1 /TAXON_ID=160604 /ORGANISM="Amphidinium massartii, Strain CS-259" /LENGTH=1373 /DNA_ID=CAMNT_0020047847 /DNA_START=36 /DNA_END=4154 /DNA_ORIENTATION=+
MDGGAQIETITMQEEAPHTLGDDEIANLKKQVQAQAALIQQLSQLLYTHGIEPPKTLDADGLLPIAKMLSKAGSMKPPEDAEMDLKMMAEKDLKGFLEKILEVNTGGKGVELLPAMEVRFKDLTVISRQKEKGGIQTVAGFFLDCFTQCFQVKKDVVLLNKLNGVIKPGRLTLLLGPPGAGKSTLMKTLSNKMKGSGVKVEGSITYNGEKADTKKFVLKKMVGYVDQRDVHIPALTVTETFNMAWQGMSGGLSAFASILDNEQLEAVKKVQAEAGTKADVCTKVLGLQTCKDTIVGNDMMRGVSGGQRKRVTLGEMMMGNFITFFLDEISTGLDSAATLDITKALRYATDVFRLSTTVALLQPAPEVYAQFDDILLMDTGNIVYHGERSKILEYFESLGFRCPPRKDVADYLQEVTTKDGKQYLMPEDELQRKNIIPPKSTEEFVQRWQETTEYKDIKKELDGPQPSYPIPKEFQVDFAQPFPASVALCAKMFRTLLLRDPAAMRAQIGQNLVLGVIIAIVFQDLSLDQVQSKMGLIFMTLMNFALGGMSTLPDGFDQRAVFYKQRDSNFYRTLAYSIAQNVVNFPVTIIKVLVFVSIIYWASSLSDANGGMHYLYFMAVCILLDFAMGQYFKVLIAVLPGYDAATPVAAVSVLFMVIFSGFIIAAEEIPEYWVWMYYINPIAYAFTGLVHNELKSDTYSEIDITTGKKLGEQYLETFGFKTEDHWMTTACIFLAAIYVVFLLLANFLLHNIRHSGATSTGGAADEATELALERCASGEDQGKGGMEFQECSVAWTHLSYAVDLPAKRGSKPERLELLHDISGCCMPGTMTALMGSSGAGKTTLLDVVAGRKTSGYTSGELYMNGHPLDRLSFSRISGYVEQTDIHTPTSTIAESFRFSARLRLPSSVTSSQIDKFVKQTLKTLELDECAGLLVGGLSVEQAKRVTIGVEIVANPSILFLDEPTSGLDARAAMLIVKVIRRLASSGRTVICTIHQPSASIFESFDSLLLLKRGGRTVFFGELGTESVNLINYLQGIPGTTPIAAGANPAVWMLDVMGAGTSGGSAVDFAFFYEQSQLCKDAEEKLGKEGVTKVGAAPKIEFKETFAAGGGLQMSECIHKAFRSYWRTPTYNATRFIIGAVVAFLFGSVYWQYEPDSYATANSMIAVVYMTTMFMGIICTMSVLPVMGTERAVFYRERAANMYRAHIYGIAVGVAEVPYIFATVAVFMNIFYWTVGFRGELGPFLYYYLFFQLYVAQATFFGQFLVCVLPNQQVAQIASALSGNIWGLFAGYMQPPQDIPEGVVFFHWANPLAFAFKGLVVTQFHEDDTQVQVAPGPNGMRTMHDFVFQLRFPEMDYEDRYLSLAFLVGFIVVW